MVMVDSSVWINYFNGIDSWQTNLLDQLLSEIPVVMGDLIYIEVLQGFRSDKDYTKAKSSLSILPFMQIGGHEVAEKSVENYRILRKKGVTVRKTIDVVIGTYCILENLSLLHDDKDFIPMVEHLSLKELRVGIM